jgi:hypothetical protein
VVLPQARFAISAAASEDKGRRTEMEDVWVITEGARGGIHTQGGASHSHGGDAMGAVGCRCTYAAVFDGHGGKRAADFAAQHLHSSVLAAGLLSTVDDATGMPSVAASKKAIFEVRQLKIG